MSYDLNEINLSTYELNFLWQYDNRDHAKKLFIRML